MEQYGYQAYFQNETRSEINQIVFSNSPWGSINDGHRENVPLFDD